MICLRHPGNPERPFLFGSTGLPRSRPRLTIPYSCTWRWSDDSGKVAQSDSPPISGYSPMTQWEPGEIVVDQQHLQLDETVPPGRYRLLMGLYRPDAMQNLAVLQATEVLPGDRVVLAEIEVTDE